MSLSEHALGRMIDLKAKTGVWDKAAQTIVDDEDNRGAMT
jgi:hypothetical protein